MSVILTILIGLLVVGGMLLSRLMGLFTLVDLFKSFQMEKQFFDMYEKEKERRRNRDRDL